MEFILSQVSVWSYAFATLVHAVFGLYLVVAWRKGARGGFLIVATLVSALWAGASWAFSATGWIWLFQLACLLDVLRLGAWFGFLLALLSQPSQDSSENALPGWPRPWVLGVITLSAAGVLCLSVGIPVYGTPLRTWAATSLFSSVFGLVLLELFYRSVPERSRWGIKPVALALGGPVCIRCVSLRRYPSL